MEQGPRVEKTPETETENSVELSAERIKTLREVIELSRELGTSPRDAVIKKVKETGLTKEYDELPEWRRKLYNTIGIGNFEKYDHMYYEYDFALGRILQESGLVSEPKDEDEKITEKMAPSMTLDRAQDDPTQIRDLQKYKETVDKFEQDFLATNVEPIDLEDVIKDLKEIKDIKDRSIASAKEKMKSETKAAA